MEKPNRKEDRLEENLRKAGKEMELSKKRVHMLLEGKPVMNQITVDDDRNVPDYKPDMLRIIESSGKIVLEDVKSGENQVHVKGKLQFMVMYVGEHGEISIQSLESNIPLEETMHIEGLKALDTVRLDTQLEDLRIGIINSRKMSIQAIITMMAVKEEVNQVELALEAVEKQDTENLKEECEIMQLRVHKRDMMRVREEIILPKSKNNIHEILWKEVSMNVKEIRLLQGKINVCGSLLVFVLYQGEGKIEWIREEIPFTKEVECDGCSEGMIPQIQSSLKSCELEVKTDDDVEERIILTDAVIDMDIRIYEEEMVTLLSGIYSTSQELIPVTHTCEFQRLIGNNIAKCRLNHRLRIQRDEPRILQVCMESGRVGIDNIQTQEKGLLVEGTIDARILYVSAEDEMPFFVKQIQLPFTQQIDMNEMSQQGQYKVKAENIQLTSTMIDSEEVELKAMFDLAVFGIEPFEKDIIEEVREAELDMERLKNIAGIVVYVVHQGDTLFSIGKRYCMSIADIQKLNDLEGDSITPGMRLLICKNIGVEA